MSDLAPQWELRWRHCPDPESLTDEVLDRVARRPNEGIRVRSCELLPYVYGNARNVLLEFWKLGNFKKLGSLGRSAEDQGANADHRGRKRDDESRRHSQNGQAHSALAGRDHKRKPPRNVRRSANVLSRAGEVRSGRRGGEVLIHPQLIAPSIRSQVAGDRSRAFLALKHLRPSDLQPVTSSRMHACFWMDKKR